MSRPVTPQISSNVIIEMESLESLSVILIERKYEPFGWAIPGGFVEVGETIAMAARREALEETGLIVELKILLGIYSNSNRDPRGHTAGSVFIGKATGKPVAADDAKDIALFDPFNIDVELAFDHKEIMQDYGIYKREGILRLPD